MSVRVVRVWRRTDPHQTISYLIEKNGVDGAILLQNGTILSLGPSAWEIEKRNYSKICDAYGLMGILRVSPAESLLVAVTGVLSVGQVYGGDILKVTNCEFFPMRTVGSAEFIDSRLPDLQRLLCSGMFYFCSSSNYDLTCCSQRRATGQGSDPRFFWNRTLHFTFERFGVDTSLWLLKCMAGSVLIKTVYVGHRTGKVALISRLSCERVGTRFNVRGANYLGRVANFIETEQLVVFDNSEASFLQIRGSIPLFWEQPGLQVGSHKVKLRAFETSAPAYHRHMTRLGTTYGEVIVVNLLGRKEGERILSEAFRAQHGHTKLQSSIEFVDFDYHAQIKASKDSINLLRKKLIPFIERCEFYQAVDGRPLRMQKGVVRTNCLDCLDRTNCVQTVLGIHSVKSQIASLNIESGKVNVEQRIEEILKDLWQKNGDQCSTIYAGTGALDGKNKLKDASRSIARTIQNNLMDSSKQEAFDLFLTGSSFEQNAFDRASNLLPGTLIQENYYFSEYADAVKQMVERSKEITVPTPIKVFVGTWNVNGGKNINNVAFRGEANLAHWIFPATNLVSLDDNDSPDIVAIGVEELVDLNAQNLVKASTTNQRLWAETIRKTLALKCPYVLVASEQLVGVCLFLFVRPRLAPFMKDFAVSSVKTGMGGATGNKGSVAFRLVINSTSICFVCSHFAAGQNEIRDRNEDFATTMRKIRFPQGRDIESHDVIFWFGDFNYRINLSGEEVKRAIQSGQLYQLVPNDQLFQQKAQDLTFVDFDEGPLTFPPTYKYDTFSDDYDTSEKCRVPAWTDRILWKEKRTKEDTKLLCYYRSELKTSDHRPVGAQFLVNTYKVDTSKIISLVQDVISQMGPPDGTIICSVEGKTKFPMDIFPMLCHKLRELHVNVLASKCEDDELWLILESGESALAACSMDGLNINGNTLSVRLRSPLWYDSICLPADTCQVDTYVPVEEITLPDTNGFEFEDDDELCSVNSIVMPERPRPPSARSVQYSPAPQLLANLDWPSDNDVSPFPNSLPSRGSAISLPTYAWDHPNVPKIPTVPSVPSIPLRPLETVQPLRQEPPLVPTRSAPMPPPRPQMPVIPPRPQNW